MLDTRSILIITKDDGTILGAAFPVTDKDGNSTGIAALPGQTVQEVQLPEELLRLQSPEEVLRNIFDYCVPRGAACLERSGGNLEARSSLSKT